MKHKIEKYRIKGLVARLSQHGTQKGSDQVKMPKQATASGVKTSEPKAAKNLPDQGLEAIRQEGLNARQLRMARRTAQKHGLPFETDHEAVLKLRMQGIDPFRGNVLDMVANTPSSIRDDKTQFPQKIAVAKVPTVLAKQVDANPAAKRAAEIMALQKDMIKRRRRNILMLLLRLTAFIFLPTFI